MRLAALSCLLLTACGFEHGAIPGIIDAPPTIKDTPLGEGGCSSYSSLFDTCATMMGTSGITLTPGMWQYDTDTGRLSLGSSVMTPPNMTVNAAAGPIVIIFVSSFTVQQGATLRLVSPNMHRPFGIASTGPVQVDGVIDLSAAGAGARTDAQCGTQVGRPGVDNNGGGGGGGGGAFQGAGGHGSQGDADMGPVAGGAGGAGIGTRPASPIGGCDGGRGGNGNNTAGGPAGDGGGALYIASATSIAISGTGVIDAGGRGGFAGGNNGDGGGGGGSGGMIVLESKAVTIAGIVVANGGGGGEGNTNGVAGQNGQRSTQPAAGGAGGDAAGGDGAPGGAGTMLDGVASNDLQNGGGGGGGGGVGFIAIGCPAPVTSGATISPAFSAWP